MKSYLFSLFTPGRKTNVYVHRHADDETALLRALDLMQNHDAATLCTVDRSDAFGSLTAISAIRREPETVKEASREA